MDFRKTFIRPLLWQITDHAPAYVEILATRAEHDPALAHSLVMALDDLHAACPEIDKGHAPTPTQPTK